MSEFLVQLQDLFWENPSIPTGSSDAKRENKKAKVKCQKKKKKVEAQSVVNIHGQVKKKEKNSRQKVNSCSI